MSESHDIEQIAKANLKLAAYREGQTMFECNAPLMCSMGGIPFNKEHLDAKDAEIARLRSLIASAREEGAREMRERAAKVADYRADHSPGAKFTAVDIRALPLSHPPPKEGQNPTATENSTEERI